MCKLKFADRDSFEKFSKEVGFVYSIEDWAKRHGLNVYVAVYEHKEVKEEIVSEIVRKKVSSVLDLGCGYGFLTSRLNEACPNTRVIGTDISRFQIKNAKLRGIRESLVVCCGEFMPFKRAVFDCIVCSEVIEHVVSPKTVLSEIERILKTDGYLFISTDNPLSVFRKIVKIVRKIKKKKGVKEEFIPLSLPIEIIPNAIKVYKVLHRCPYPLLPAVNFFGSKILGKAWVSIASTVEKFSLINKQFCNKYIIFGVKLE